MGRPLAAAILLAIIAGCGRSPAEVYNEEVVALENLQTERNALFADMVRQQKEISDGHDLVTEMIQRQIKGAESMNNSLRRKERLAELDKELADHDAEWPQRQELMQKIAALHEPKIAELDQQIASQQQRVDEARRRMNAR